MNGTVDIGAFESRGFTMTITGGDNQVIVAKTAFPVPLCVALSSAFAEPVAGGVRTFSAPTSGPSAAFPSGTTATLDAAGHPSISPTANIDSGTYLITAKMTGSLPVDFHLESVGGNTVPIITILNGTTSGVRGQQLQFTGAFTDPDPDTWTGTVNFGDGTGDQPLTLNGKSFAFDHAYASLGSYTFVVTVSRQSRRRRR